MCESAQEIQKSKNPFHLPSSGENEIMSDIDIVYVKSKMAEYPNERCVFPYYTLGISLRAYSEKHNRRYFYEDIFETIVWMPKQGQLQDILYKDLKLSGVDFIGINVSFNVFVSIYYKLYNSFEQFWLAFVMKEKYNKIWDGENWIEATKPII
jgi:hypothetical protein